MYLNSSMHVSCQRHLPASAVGSEGGWGVRGANGDLHGPTETRWRVRRDFFLMLGSSSVDRLQPLRLLPQNYPSGFMPLMFFATSTLFSPREGCWTSCSPETIMVPAPPQSRQLRHCQLQWEMVMLMRRIGHHFRQDCHLKARRSPSWPCT